MIGDVENVSDIVLESQVAILTGGVDQNDIPLITFPTDSADMVDLYGAGEILRLLQAYVRISGGKVAVLVDLQHEWTQDCITKLTVLLDELQMSLRHCLTTVYLVKPRLRNKQKFLHRELSRKYGPGLMVPYYDVIRVESHEELYDHVDRSQLTADYGGTLNYNHLAWIDFIKTYTPVTKDAEKLLSVIPKLKGEVKQLYQCTKETRDETYRKELTAKYEAILSRANARESLARCNQAINDLETLEESTDLSKMNAIFVVRTSTDLRQMINQITAALDEMDTCLQEMDGVRDVQERIKQCRENANEVKETILILHEQIRELPHVGDCLYQAYRFRQQFITEILNPSKQIVACSTVILKQLDTGKSTTPKSYAAAFEIARQLTESLQPFTQDINELNDTYTRVHLFYVLMSKVERWTVKAATFIVKCLLDNLVYNEISDMESVSGKQNGAAVNGELNIDTIYTRNTLNAIRKGANGSIRDTQNNTRKGANVLSDRHKLVCDFPDRWSALREKFLQKHSPPRKRHLRLLTKNVPKGVPEGLKTEANNLVERTIFILSFLDKNDYRVGDVMLIDQWKRDMNQTESPPHGFIENNSDVTSV